MLLVPTGAAVGALGVAAAPLVAEGRGRLPGPAAGRRRQLLADGRCAGDRRRRDVGRRRGGGADGADEGGVGACLAGAVVGGDGDEDGRADVAADEGVAGAVGADGAAVGALAVAALPLVAEGRGRLPGPAAGRRRQLLADGRGAGDRRRRDVGRRRVGGADWADEGGVGACLAGAVVGGDGDEDGRADVAADEGVAGAVGADRGCSWRLGCRSASTGS